MTQPLRIESRIGHDGVLTLRVPLALADADAEVVVTIQPKDPAQAGLSEWPPGYFAQTYGSLADDPLTIPDDPFPAPERFE